MTLQERLRFLASGQDDIHSVSITEAADALDAQEKRIKELEGALRAVLDDFYDDEDVQYSTADRAQEALK